MILLWCLMVLMLISALFFIACPLVVYSSSAAALSKKKILFIGCIFLSFIGYFYFYIDGSQAYRHDLQLKQAEKSAVAQFQKTHDLNEIILKLRHHLKQDSKSAQGWYLLGKLYLVKQAYQEALFVFDRARTLQPKNSLYQFNYFQTSLIVHRHLNVSDIILLKRMIREDHNNTEALNLLAMNDYLNQNYKSAIMIWEKLLTLLPDDDRARQDILVMIDRAEAKNLHLKKDRLFLSPHDKTQLN